ncbi:hypothetical protein BGW42_002156 [Actinomortierella wolfii]|nr:hypothetical protein BGW42_002156 [Actinomortierella wolfii]
MKFGTFALATLATAFSVISAAPIVKQSPSIVPGTAFDHFFVLVLENTDYKEAERNKYFQSLAKKGTLLTNLHATTHPSQPNYLAMISGSTQGNSDSRIHNYKSKTIVDLLEEKGISWKTYQEDYPGKCYQKEDANDELYVRKHNPFISFKRISRNRERCAKIVNAKQLNVDLANNDLPQFSFYTPNMKNDGHETSLSYVARWLKRFLEPKLSDPNFINNTVVLVTFDEDDSEQRKNKNRVYSILLGDAVRSPPGTKDNTNYNHYSILATLEQNWDLGNLRAGDVKATPFKNLG